MALKSSLWSPKVCMYYCLESGVFGTLDVNMVLVQPEPQSVGYQHESEEIVLFQETSILHTIL